MVAAPATGLAEVETRSVIGLHHRLVLNSDVVFRADAAPPKAGQEAVADVIVTRTASRSPSLAVSPETAEFLLSFTVPCPLSVAVQLIAKRADTPADEVLTELYPNLRIFLDRGILVRTGRTRRGTEARRIGAWVLQKPINDFDDSSVFLVKNEAGQFGALKLVRNRLAPGIIHRECRVLELAGTDLVPALLDHGSSPLGPYMVAEWKSGVVAAEAFRELRAARDSRPALLRMAITLVEAFERLHERGIIHGDIQPKNAVFDLQGRVWVIDFSHSIVPGLAVPSWRVGVPFFYEPEYAKALLNDPRQSVTLNLRGENYAIAALVFYLLSGVHTLEFSVERETMLRQITELDARPLVDSRGATWPSADRALRPYLAKDPEQRPSTLAPMRDSLAAAIEQEAGPEAPHFGNGSVAAPLFGINLHTAPEGIIKQRFGLGSARLRDFDLATPRCSLTFGAAGISYALLRAAELCDDPELLWAADAWIEQAEQHAGEPEAFTSTRIGLTRRKVGYVSLSCSEPGMFFVKSLVRAATGDATGTRAAVGQFLAAATYRKSHPADVNLGGAGLALAADRLSHLPLPAEHRRKLCALRDRLVDSAWEASAPSFRSRSRLGFAHGVSGVVFGALTTGRSPEADEASAGLRRLPVMMRRGVHWPVRGGSDYFMHGWCNGVAGHLLMWTRLWQCSGLPEDRDMMERAAWGVWESRIPMGNLCCGAAGQAAALAAFACAAAEPRWRKRAVELLQNLKPRWPKDDHPQSLFRGELGLLLVRLECESGASARFPVWGASLG
jgi:serine/threonine protein kinase